MANYINGNTCGQRIKNFIQQKCEKSLWKTCEKSLRNKIKEEVPTITKGTGHATRYEYNEEFLGETMYDWYRQVYPKIKQRAATDTRTTKRRD